MFIQTLHSLQLAGRYIGDFGNFYSGFAKSPRVLYSTANDPQPQMIPRPQMIPKMDRKWSSTASDPQSRQQMIPKEK